MASSAAIAVLLIIGGDGSRFLSGLLVSLGVDATSFVSPVRDAAEAFLVVIPVAQFAEPLLDAVDSLIDGRQSRQLLAEAGRAWRTGAADVLLLGAFLQYLPSKKLRVFSIY